MNGIAREGKDCNVERNRVKMYQTQHRSLTGPITFAARLFFRFAGYQVRVIGRKASAREAPILLFAPHSSFLDAFVAHWTGLPSLIIRSQDRDMPLFGRKYSGPSLFVVLTLPPALLSPLQNKINTVHPVCVFVFFSHSLFCLSCHPGKKCHTHKRNRQIVSSRGSAGPQLTPSSLSCSLLHLFVQR